MAMDVVDYEIKGAEMQFVEVELDPGEAAVGEAGSMMFMESGIVLDTIFGDGSQASSGLWGALVGAGKRLITGANVFTLVRVSHIHLFGVTFIFFIVGLIFSHAYVRPVWLKCTVVALPPAGVAYRAPAA